MSEYKGWTQVGGEMAGGIGIEFSVTNEVYLLLACFGGHFSVAYSVYIMQFQNASYDQSSIL